MTLRALLFDVDGTLADTEDTHRRAFNAAFRDLGLSFAWDEAKYAALLDIAGGKERLASYFAHIEAPGIDRRRFTGLVASLHRRKTERFAELVATGGSPLRPGIARLIGEAERAEVLVGIASTTTPANVAALLRAELGPRAEARFAVIACGDRVAAKKPAPDVYRLALSSLGVDAAEAVAFEDSAQGVRAAKTAGLFTVVTPTRWTLGQDLGAADVVLPHLGDPDLPLEGEDAVLAGGAFVTLAALKALHGG